MTPTRFSNLSLMAQSPAHYRHRLVHGLMPTRAMRIGTAVHHLLLGGQGFVVYEGDRRGKAWAEFKAAVEPGVEVLTATENAVAIAIAGAVMSTRQARATLERCPEKEQSLSWSWLGREITSRVDARSEDELVELKVSMTSHPEKIWRHMTNQLWHAQLAFYRRAVEASGVGPRPTKVTLIAVEARAPHVCTVFSVGASDLEDGDRMTRSWMEQLAACEESNVWPGYVQMDEPCPIVPPGWAGADDDEGVEEDEEDEGDEENGSWPA